MVCSDRSHAFFQLVFFFLRITFVLSSSQMSGRGRVVESCSRQFTDCFLRLVRV